MWIGPDRSTWGWLRRRAGTATCPTSRRSCLEASDRRQQSWEAAGKSGGAVPKAGIGDGLEREVALPRPVLSFLDGGFVMVKLLKLEITSGSPNVEATILDNSSIQRATEPPNSAVVVRGDVQD